MIVSCILFWFFLYSLEFLFKKQKAKMYGSELLLDFKESILLYGGQKLKIRMTALAIFCCILRGAWEQLMFMKTE